VAQQLPIFELPLALLPGERVPLHIFEERYKRMVGGSLESGEPFGIILSDDDGARSVGCTAVVEEVLERFEDGRLNVVVTGERPFRVLDRSGNPEEPGAEVELIEESGAGEEAEGAGAARSAFLDLAERASGERPDEAEVASESAYGLAAKVELPADTKQQLLQTRDEGERMRLLADVFDSLLEALGQAEEVAERAQSNGKVRIGP
jgi:Lon protease-like protein